MSDDSLSKPDAANDYYARPEIPRGAISFLTIVSIIVLGGAFYLISTFFWSDIVHMRIVRNGGIVPLSIVILCVILVGVMAFRLRKTWREKSFELLRKEADFLAGFFGVIVFGFIANFFAGVFFFSGDGSGMLVFTLPLALFLAIAWAFSRGGRRYITIGMFSSAIIPLLVFGACLFVLRGL